MTVYILFRETYGDDGYIEAVYATEAAAETECDAKLREAIAEGHAVWRNPDDPDHEEIDWTHNWVVNAHEVLT